jgi:hypothetical protein
MQPLLDMALGSTLDDCASGNLRLACASITASVGSNWWSSNGCLHSNKVR